MIGELPILVVQVTYGVHTHLYCIVFVHLYRAVNSVWLNVIDMVAGIVLMLLALFEDPPSE